MYRTKYELTGVVFILLIVLMPSALGINVQGSTDGAGFSMNIGAADSDTVKASAVLGESSVSNSIKGGGSLAESHWVSNTAGARAEVGVDIQNAKKYSYRYSLDPGRGGNWRKSVVTAREFLDVDNADYVKAYATAHNVGGDDAYVDVEVTDGSLKGYSNIATASANKAEACESGHILGTFTATATATGSLPKIRTSNYGVEYDLLMGAKVDSGSPTVSGTLGYYVDDDRGETIQGAVNAADFGDIIKVAAGTYRENVKIDKSLEIKGAGACNTIVDGGNQGRVFTIYPNLDVTLAGMTIQNGNADVDPYLTRLGGGILNDKSTLTVENCDIRHNTANVGGGIYNYARSGTATATVKNSDISDNTAGYSGGGIYNFGRSGTATAIVEKSNIHDNIASGYGGGIINYAYGGTATATVEKSNIYGNTAYIGGGISNYAFDGGTATATVKNGDIRYNTADSSGGGISNIAQSGTATAIVEKSNVHDNIAGEYGGGVCNFGGNLVVDKSKITKNTANVDGGGIYNDGGTVTLTGSQVTKNKPNNIAP